ncbi:MAG: hypothetical protein AAF585_12950 [Verrucomicrobiota bacterium]
MGRTQQTSPAAAEAPICMMMTAYGSEDIAFECENSAHKGMSLRDFGVIEVLLRNLVYCF